MYQFFSWLLQPYIICWLTIDIGLILVWRSTAREQRRRLWLLIVPWCAMTLLMTAGVAYLLNGSLEWQYDPLVDRPDDSQAIVVLGGGVRKAYGVLPSELSESGLRRCQRAAELYQQGAPLPIFLAGTEEEMQASRQALIAWNVPDKNIFSEPESTTTHENAAETMKLLKPRQLNRLLLVTDAAHLPRAVRAFARQGADVIPAGCNYRLRAVKTPLSYFVIGPHSAAESSDALHEWFGIGWYWLRGRI